MVGKRLFFQILWRIALLILTGAGAFLVVFRMQGRESIFTLIVGVLLILIQVYLLTRYVLRINKTLTSFVESVGLRSAPELHFSLKDPLLSGLESRLNQLKSEVSQSRLQEQKQKSLLDIVVGSMYTGLICVNQEGDVVFSNRGPIPSGSTNQCPAWEALGPRIPHWQRPLRVPGQASQG